MPGHHNHAAERFRKDILSDPSYVTGLQTHLQQQFLYNDPKTGRPYTIEGKAGKFTQEGLQRWAGLTGDDVDGTIGHKSLAAIYQKLKAAPNDPIAQYLLPRMGTSPNQMRGIHSTVAAATSPATEPPDAPVWKSGALPPIVIGCSVADGIRAKMGGPADQGIPERFIITKEAKKEFVTLTLQGRKPNEVLDVINLYKDALKGRDVVLSPGASNNADAAYLAEDQVKALRAAGVHDIVMVGVGKRQDFVAKQVNKQEGDIALAARVGFTGPLADIVSSKKVKVELRRNGKPTSWDYDVHPTDDGFTIIARDTIPKIFEERRLQAELHRRAAHQFASINR
jgi:hypothetical protein